MPFNKRRAVMAEIDFSCFAKYRNEQRTYLCRPTGSPPTCSSTSVFSFGSIVGSSFRRAADPRTDDGSGPTSPHPAGTIVPSPSQGKARVGVWIMPNNSSAGMLETFFQYAIPEDSGRLWQTAVSKVDKVRADFPEENRFKTAHLDKAKMHTYLAWRDPPGVPIGQAIVKGLLSHDSDRTRVFLRWLSETLELPLTADAA